MFRLRSALSAFFFFAISRRWAQLSFWKQNINVYVRRPFVVSRIENGVLINSTIYYLPWRFAFAQHYPLSVISRGEGRGTKNKLALSSCVRSARFSFRIFRSWNKVTLPNAKRRSATKICTARKDRGVGWIKRQIVAGRFAQFDVAYPSRSKNNTTHQKKSNNHQFALRRPVNGKQSNSHQFSQ